MNGKVVLDHFFERFVGIHESFSSQVAVDFLWECKDPRDVALKSKSLALRQSNVTVLDNLLGNENNRLFTCAINKRLLFLPLCHKGKQKVTCDSTIQCIVIPSSADLGS